jgi:hypothetical protein
MVAARLMPNLLDAVEPSGSPDDGKVEFRLGSELSSFAPNLGRQLIPSILLKGRSTQGSKHCIALIALDDGAAPRIHYPSCPLACSPLS